MTREQALKITGGLSTPSKMPCHSYSIPASRCKTGGKLRGVAGTVCEHCYAMKGRYYFGNVQRALERRFKAIRNKRWVEAMTLLIRGTGEAWFRWHDSGDVQDMFHLRKICDIAEALPHVRFWLPTKEAKLCRDYFSMNPMPPNLTVRISMPRVDQPALADTQFTYSQVHTSKVNGAVECPSRTQGHKCLDCRQCWDRDIHSISYLAH